MRIQEGSWVAHYIVPCSGDDTCKHCKPGEPRPLQHTFSKRVTEPISSSTPPAKKPCKNIMYEDSDNPTMPISVAKERYLKKRKLIGSIFGNLELIPFDPELDPEPFTCYKCWSNEHLCRDCPEPNVHPYCRNCGRRDVEVQDCPRCAVAYREFLKSWEGKDQERRQLSAALYNSRQFYREEDLFSFDGCMSEKGKESEQVNSRRVADESCEVRIMSQGSFYDECGSSKSPTSRKKFMVEDECWTDPDDDEGGVYQSVGGSFATAVESMNTKDKSEKDHYESVASFAMSHEKIAPVPPEDEFCSDYDDYASTRAGFIRENCSLYSNDNKQENGYSSSSSSSSFEEEYSPALSEKDRAERDAYANKVFAYIRNWKMEEEVDDIDYTPLKAPSPKRKSLYAEDDEVNYDDVIVDENERSESLCSEDYAIIEFLDLLDALKHLPIEVQNKAVLHFVSERRKQYHQNQERIQREFSDL